MKEKGDVRTPLHVVDAVLGEPVETLEEEEEREEGDELGAQVVSEDGEGQAGLCDGVPAAFDEMLHFRGSQLAEEHFPHEFPHEENEDERLEVDDGHARIGLGQVHDTRVELLLLVVGIPYDPSSQDHAAQGDQ